MTVYSDNNRLFSEIFRFGVKTVVVEITMHSYCFVVMTFPLRQIHSKSNQGSFSIATIIIYYCLKY